MTKDATVRAAFQSQALACRELGSPFNAMLCALAAERLNADDPVGHHVLTWPGNPSPDADSVPLRLAGALHALIDAAGRLATEAAPLARLSLEADGGKPGAGLVLQTWPNGARHDIGRADFHGRWVISHA